MSGGAPDPPGRRAVPGGEPTAGILPPPLRPVERAVTSTFITRAQRERRAAEAAEAQAPGGADARLDDFAQRLDRIEALLRDLQQR